jgi:hypothetical protein
MKFWFGLVLFMTFNATFNNISVISWRSVLLVEETGVSEKTTDLSRHWQTLSHNVVSSYTSPWTGFRTHKFSWIQIQYYLKLFMWENSGIFTSGTTLSVVVRAVNQRTTDSAVSKSKKDKQKWPTKHHTESYGIFVTDDQWMFFMW